MRRSDLLLAPIFFLLAVLFLIPVTLGGQTLIPADNLFAFPPWHAFAAQFNAAVPHNELLSDLLLENYAWKRFIVASIQQREVPLWNPYLFTGVPFLAAGQHSALYPLSVLFYIFPLEAAYGWFAALQLGIAGTAMYALARTLGLSRAASTLSALTYEFSGFFVVSLVFPMVLGAAGWLPLLLLCVEHVVCGNVVDAGANERDQSERGRIAWLIAGASVLGVSVLAGHVEITYYNLIVMVFYAVWRLSAGAIADKRRGMRPAAVSQYSATSQQSPLRALRALGALVVLGLALAAVQLVPLYELASRSFREGSQDYSTIVGYAYPMRQIVTFFLPDFFGNPAQHAYFDLFARAWTPVTHDFNGNSINTIFWGLKNYVEAGSYLGILPLLLALVAVASLFRAPRGALPAGPRLRGPLLLFTVLALLSLAFMFGTPLYALLFYALPGWNQLHSPFRWVYPFTLSMAVLAGIGAQRLTDGWKDSRDRSTAVTRLPSPVLFGWLPLSLGAAILIVLAVSLLMPSPVLGLADRILRGSDLAQRAFPDARAFFSYEALNIARFALFLIGGSGVILVASRQVRVRLPFTAQRAEPVVEFLKISAPSTFSALKGISLWQLLAILLVMADLFTFGLGFYTAADPQLLAFVPPAIQFLQQDHTLFRVTTLDSPGDKTLNPNAGMFYGLQDLRGYDSLIPKQYAEWMNMVEGQGELLYNRIAPLYCACNLDSALLDLANVKYVLTTQIIANPKFTKVYSGEINIYRNERVLPRAFIVHDADTFRDTAQLKSLDPATKVLIDGPLPPAEPSLAGCLPALDAAVTRYSANEVVVEASSPGACAGWLVLADAYSDGWQTFDAANGAREHEVMIYRADGNFRAVFLSAGQHTIRFRYNPLSFRVGLYLSFIAAIALILLAGYWAWGRLKREQVHERSAQRVLKNSALPMATALLNKAIDTIFAAFMLRMLGVENAGKYAFAVIVITYCDIFVNFGFSTLLTRDVARERASANRYLSHTIVMRLVLLVLLAPLLTVFLWGYHSFAALSDDTSLAIVLLALSLVPSALAGALSSVFYAYEQMEYPAAVTVVSTLLKVTLGVVVLLAGLGFVGLAGASIVVNTATLALLLYLFVRRFFVPRFEFDAQLGRGMLGTSYPLMINDFLQRAFNRVDVLLLQPMKGDAAVGWYTTAYKYLDGLNILPSTFTIALFPVLSRYAAGAPDALLRAYVKSIKYLLMLAMPLTVLSFAYSDWIIFLFGGSAYLPESAIALRLIIWFLPLSFINNVTHYVLIAVNQQHYLTRAFIAGALFNLVANLIFIPLYSYRAAALITILSELVLLVPFYIGIRRHVGKVDWLGILRRPVLAGLVMSLLVAWLDYWLGTSIWSFLLIVPASIGAYGGTLIVSGAFNADDREMIRLLMPKRLRVLVGGN